MRGVLIRNFVWQGICFQTYSSMCICNGYQKCPYITAFQNILIIKLRKKINTYVFFDRQYVMIMQITHKASVSTSALGVSDGVSHMLFNYERLIT